VFAALVVFMVQIYAAVFSGVVSNQID